MRYALIIVLGACYFLGWLPVDLVVPALMAVSLLRVPSRSTGPPPRRGGYIHPPSPASAGENPAMVNRVLTYTDSFRQPGAQSEVRTAFTTPLGASRTSGPGSYMSAWGFAPGHLTTDADTIVLKRGTPEADFPLFWDPTRGAPGDCGCGDAA